MRLKVSTMRNAIAYYSWLASGSRKPRSRKVLYIGEGGDWVIGRIGRRLTELMSACGIPFQTRESSRFAFSSIIHFGSVHAFARSGTRWVGGANRIVVTMYHSDRGVSPAMDAGIDAVLRHEKDIDRIVTSTSIMDERLASWGFPRSKIVRIPIAVDVSQFRVADAASRLEMRSQLEIPHDAICVGSFQKDGEGWGEGMSPKLIKGPDLFIEVVTRLSRSHNVHCLLTGPSRGYVKAGLDRAGVPYTHRMVEDYGKIGDYYGCLDLYLVTSREEGGPLALMECMATGIPLVTTKVGMAPDIVVHGRNGFLVDVGDVDGLVELAARIIGSPELRSLFRLEGLEAVKALDYGAVSAAYERLYSSLINQER